MIQKYSITGMSCDGCRSHVENAFKGVKGVHSASVKLAEKEAVIDAEDGVGLTQLEDALKGTNYQVHPFGSATGGTKKKLNLKPNGNGVYYCPMHCEGDKTYEHPGSCPVCGMDLIEQPSSPFKDAKTFYTCPMHPEIKQDHPGICPKCGMDLVPVIAAAGKEENKTYLELLKKFKISVGLTLPIFIISMSGMIPNNPLYQIMDLKYWNWVEFALSIPVVCYTTLMFFERAWRSLVTRNLNMFTLIGIGAGVAWIFSVFALLFPEVLPIEFKADRQTPHVYFEAATVILTLVLLGQLLEARAHGKTNEAIKAIINLAPNEALILEGGKEKLIAVQDIQAGNLIKIKPGSKIPVDGVVKEGSSILDESMITGEPIPVEKNPGDPVIGGTLNGNQTFIMEAEKVGADTLLAQIVNLVNQASASKAPVQKLADKISGYFVPIVVLVALITYLIWTFLGPQPSGVYALVNAIAVLIIACPCALGLATPMAVKVGLGKGARSGILIKDAAVLENTAKANVLIVDKTGTLTEGNPTVDQIIPLQPNWKEQDLLQRIISLNNEGSHPLAVASLKKGTELGLNPLPINNFEQIAGAGVKAVFQGRQILLGNETLLYKFGIKVPESVRETVAKQQKQGKTISYLAEDTTLLGYIVFSDKIKTGAQTAIRQLQQEGMEIWMFTGDNKQTAQFVAQELGLDGFKAGMLPQDKFEGVKAFQQKGMIVAMAGDGINDAPALTKADVGIAMGTGTDIAIESAAITLVGGDLKGIARARKLSEATMKNIRQNLWFALGYNTIGIPIAAGILYPFFGLLLSPMIAALAMSFSSVSVITNSLRLRNAKIE